MLRFDVYEPAPFGLVEKVRSKAEKRGNPIIPDNCKFQVFVDGKAERELGFDLPVLLDGRMPTKTGIYDCFIGGKSGCLYLWENDDVKTNDVIFDNRSYEKYFSGLIVYRDDKQSCKSAMQAMEKRIFFI